MRLGVTPLLVGLTVVAYGTSTPELIVSSMAAAKGQGAIAIGNAVGSNIFNIGVILGLTALICPMRVQLQLLKFDTPVMVGVASAVSGVSSAMARSSSGRRSSSSPSSSDTRC